MEKVKVNIIVMLLLFVATFAFGCKLEQQGDSKVDMTPRQISAEANLSAEDVVENVKSAVVGISAHTNYSVSVGSGVAIANGGYILTNHHVVNNAKTLLVYLANQTQTTAKFIWADASLDLAIIKADKNLPYLQSGTSKNLKVGQDVLAIGTPLTLQFKHTVTKGIVSALNRTLEIGDSDANYLQNLIQHDASINPGNSGGPLISLDSKLVGINTLKASEAEGIGFAIPIEVGMAVTERVINNQSYVPAYIGLFGLDSQIAAFYNQTSANQGVYIVEVESGSPAQEAGIKEGDILVEVGNNAISNMLDLRVSLYQIDQGERVTIKVVRDGQQLVFELKPQQRP